nr:aminopeptidase P family protein [uncultured Blautia sp.]
MLDKILKDRKIQAILIIDPYNMRHVSGFRGGEGALYISATQTVLITDSRYTEAAAKESSFTVLQESNQHKREEILKECMEKEQVQGDFAMGYEDQAMLCCDFDKLKEALPVQCWVPLESSINDLRQVKTQEEIQCLKMAEEIGDRAFAKLLPLLKPGMTELEAAAELEYLMKKEGAEDLSFNTIVASGLNSSMPHAIPSAKKFEEGDFITFDFGCKYKGYCSDMTRTVVLGKASDKQKEIYNVVLKAQLAGLEALKAGKSGASVDKVARDIIAEAGYGEYFGHGLGHSVGLFIHENPRLSPSDDTILQENMIETVEPGIYVPGFGGVRIEDMVVVTKDGHINLAHSPKELIELPVK